MLDPKEAEFRQCILSLAASLVKIQVGPSNHPEVYDKITEGRRDWKRPDGSTGKYSWCGDFVTYVLSECGLIAPDMLNRNPNWEIGRNISKLIFGAQARHAWLDTAPSMAALADGSVLGGDVIVLVRPDGDHVGFIEKAVHAATVITLDGNSIGGVAARNTRHLGSQWKVRGIIRMGPVLGTNQAGPKCGPSDALCGLLSDLSQKASPGIGDFPPTLASELDALLAQIAPSNKAIRRSAPMRRLLNTRYGTNHRIFDSGRADRRRFT